MHLLCPLAVSYQRVKVSFFILYFFLVFNGCNKSAATLPEA